MPKKGNIANLKPFGQGHRTVEEEREIQKRGGDNSGISRNQKSELLNDIVDVLNGVVTTKDGKKQKMSRRIAMAITTKAANGNVAAFHELMKYLYGESIDVTSSDGSMTPLDIKIKVVDPKIINE